jgi:hypothetical protein
MSVMCNDCGTPFSEETFTVFYDVKEFLKDKINEIKDKVKKEGYCNIVLVKSSSTGDLLTLYIDQIINILKSQGHLISKIQDPFSDRIDYTITLNLETIIKNELES